MEAEYQVLRKAMVHEIHNQIASLSMDRVDVRLKRKYVEKYKSKAAFTYLSEHDKVDLIENIAGLVTMNDYDNKALEFDNLIYGLMLAQLEGAKGFTRFKNATVYKATILLNKTTNEQVKAKIPVLKEIVEEEFWDTVDILNFERIRLELRDLMKFAVTDAPRTIYTNLVDNETERIIGKEFELSYDFADYKLKVNRYIEENTNNIAIHKL